MWQLADEQIINRLLLGTAAYPSLHTMEEAIRQARVNVITVSLKRHIPQGQGGNLFWDRIQSLGCHLLPNTAGCKDAQTAITTAQMARDLFATNWIKLEVIGDDYTLQPDPFELLKAAVSLVKLGFEVFPYCTDDLILCQKLVDAGCRILMPWAAPIGSGKGILNPYALQNLRMRFPDITLIVDAGIGKPSHAVQVMELGFDAVLINSAVAHAVQPVTMASAFRDAVVAGRLAYEAGFMPERNLANPSTSLVDTPFWQQESRT